MSSETCYSCQSIPRFWLSQAGSTKDPTLSCWIHLQRNIDIVLNGGDEHVKVIIGKHKQ